jgi:hypothetical protein
VSRRSLTLEKRAQRTDRKHANTSEGLHTRGKFRSRGTQWHCGLCKLSHGRHTQSLRRLPKVNSMCKICKWDLIDPEQILRSLPTEDPRGPLVGGRTWAKRRARSVRRASKEHAPSTTQSDQRPFLGSFVGPHPATLACALPPAGRRRI